MEGFRDRTQSAKRGTLAAPVLLPILLVLGVLSLSCTVPRSKVTIEEPKIDAEFAYRDPRIGISFQGFKRKDVKALDRGLSAFYKRQYTEAVLYLEQGRKGARDKAPYDLGLIYVAAARGEIAHAATACEELIKKRPGYFPALETCGDLLATERKDREAIERYRQALKVDAGDARLSMRLSMLRTRLWKQRLAEGNKALQTRDFEAARRAGLSLVELDSKLPDGYRILAKAAAQAEKDEDAYSWAQQAMNRGAGQSEWLAFLASLAMKTAKYAEAAGYYDMLSERDPAYRENAEAARLEFRIQNLPEGPRKAALSQRLTRAQFATLLWLGFVDIRSTPIKGPVEIATDVVDHPERQAIVRAIGLGFLSVSKETHQAGVDWTFSRGEFATAMRKLAVLNTKGKSLPACLATEPASLQALAACGILPLSSARTVTGREALQAIEKTARISREGLLR